MQSPAQLAAKINQNRAVSIIRKPGVIITLFVVFSLVMGGIAIAHTPVGGTPDVWSHIYRINSIYHGDLMAHRVDAVSQFDQISSENYGGTVDWDIINLSLKYPGITGVSVPDVSSITVSNQYTADIPFNNTAVYSPVPYVPYLITFAICRAVPALDSALTIFYALELVTLVVFIALMSLSLALLPRFRIAVALIYFFFFFVMGRYQGIIIPICTGCDLMTCTFAALLGSLLLRYYFRYPTRRGFFYITVCAGVLALSKFSYAPLMFTPFLLLFAHRRIKKSLSLFVVAAASLVLLVLWVSYGANFASNPTFVTYAMIQARSAALQADPLPFLQKLFTTVMSFRTYEGQFSFQEAACVFLAWVGPFVMIILSLTLGFKKKMPWRRVVFWLGIAILMLMTLFLIYLAMYLQYDPVGTLIIFGVQVRYYLPLTPFLAMGVLEGIRIATDKSRATVLPV